MGIFLQILTLLGAVCLFLLGLSLLSGGLQKVAGDGMHHFLAAMTSNPLKQILTGIGVTALIQSSTATAMQSSLLYSVCVMHTLFNVVITLIFVWFVPSFVKLLCRIFPSKNEDEEYRLLYISGGPLSTPELSLDEAKQEICNFGRICHKGFIHLREAINENNPEMMDERIAKLVHYEEITDKIEYEIAVYLNEVSKARKRLSTKSFKPWP